VRSLSNAYSFYNRAEIEGKTLWFDFDRKFNALLIDAVL